MAGWSDLLPPLLVAAVLLYAPGGLVAAAARLPIRAAVAVAPALSVALIAGTGAAAPMVGLTWGPGPVAGAGSSSARMPAVTRSSASREAVERVMPVAAATSARETGSGEDRTRRATRARLAVRRVDWRADVVLLVRATP